MAEAASSAGIQIVTGDTKVVSRGAVDGIFINTSGIGIIEYEGSLSVKSIQPGDVIILNGTIGDHGAAIMKARENLGFEADIISDSAPLNGLIAEILKVSPDIHCMRDATRGGLGAILAEIAQNANIRINISEQDIPVCENVRGICEILGLDPIFLANEGKMVLFCPAAEAAKVLCRDERTRIRQECRRYRQCRGKRAGTRCSQNFHRRGKNCRSAHGRTGAAHLLIPIPN